MCRRNDAEKITTEENEEERCISQREFFRNCLDCACAWLALGYGGGSGFCFDLIVFFSVTLSTT